ncbi:hypothetical protein MJO28_000432 [Puccinia striiformis f. sp. tritici]|uniref:Uncharacterized protein n=1 Tax=Puccinia striiformis f. sp. tritici TaxID=168172 RepID=A0ACC0EXE3_9BASI|nr:hypothetical protein MJO28_000432 [Puccinia striiformis f. sp. tritici]
MVVTRRSAKTTKEQLFGPLPPPTRRRPGPTILDRRRKLQLRQLSKLPPLPLSPPPTPPHRPNTHIGPDILIDNIDHTLAQLQLSNHDPTSSVPRSTDLLPFPSNFDVRPPSPFISKTSHIFTQFLARHPILTNQSPQPITFPHPVQMSTPTATSDPTPRTKFLQQPSIYKQDVEALLADGSNFNRWKRGLTRIIHLCLGHNNFFDATTNYSKLSSQEQTCLLFLIQITIHNELSSLVDRFSTGTEAYDAVQTNFQGSVRFRQIELVDKLLEFKISGPTTEPNQMAGLFNRIFEVFSDLQKVGAGLPPIVESLVLQAVCPTPTSMSRSQLFQNISLQLGSKKDVTARDIQAIITSAYGESMRFDQSHSPNVSVFQTWPNQAPTSSSIWGQPPQNNSWGPSRPNPIRTPHRNSFQQSSNNPRSQQPNNPPADRQNVGRPGHPTVEDISAAINNIRKGNNTPNDPSLFIGKPCRYCEGEGHWRSFCPVLRRDANLPPPNTPLNGRPVSGFARQATLPNGPPIGNDQGMSRSAMGADATSVAGSGTVLDSGATHHVSGSFQSFLSLLPLRPPMKLNLASSDGSMMATHSGHLRITSGDGTLTIPKVLYSPEMTGTLLSLGQLLDSGFKPFFLPNHDILLLSDFVSITACYQNRSWFLSPSSLRLIDPSARAVTSSQTTSPNSASYDWHCRLGHVSDNIVKDFLKRFVPTFDLKTWSPFICESCKHAKSERRRHHLPETIPRDTKLDLLVTDVLGPLDPDIHGNCFLLTVRDHATTYSFVFPMKARSEVPHIIIALVKKITSFFKTSPRYIRCDNAKEYTVKPLSDYLASATLLAPPLTTRFSPPISGLTHTAAHVILSIGSAINAVRPAHSNYGQEDHPMPGPFIPLALERPCTSPKNADARWIREDGPATWSDIRTTSGVGKPFIPSPSVMTNNHIVRRVLHLGQEKTKEICDEQDSLIDNIQAISDADIPTSLKIALKSPAATTWKSACLTEWDQLEQIDTFAVEDKENKHSIGTRFVFDIKRKTNGSIEKFKARFVVRGFKQRLGIDVRSTFAPTASLTTLKMLLTLAIKNRWIINSFDITGAFVHSPIEETIYVDPPTELFPHLEGKVLRLKKALYGTRQASRCWWKHFKNLLHGWGFQCDEVEECLYRYKKDDQIIIIWIHVDDGIVFSNDALNLDKLRNNMEGELRVKWDSRPEKLVGLKLEYEDDSIFLSQHLLIDQTIDKFKSTVLPNPVPTYTPLPSDTLVTSWGDPISPTLYQSFIGSINYLALGTRPDLSFAVNYLARFSANPNETHWAALKHLLQYIATTRNKRLRLQVTDDKLINWTDANWGGEFQRSTSGFIIYFLGSPIAWGSRRQKVVATSTCAAEFIALGSSVDFLLFLIPIIKSLGIDPPKVLKCDNRAAVLVSDDNASKGRMKSLERNFFFVNDAVREHNITLDWVPTSSNIADFFTKPLRANLHSISLDKIFK